MFLIYINDLPGNIQSTFVKLLQMTHPFFLMFLTDTLQDELNYDLQKVSDWAFQWKIQFNPDPKKQAQEVIFSKKAESNNSLPLTFNKIEVRTCQSQKHLGLILDEGLSFTEHIDSKISKSDKLIGIIKTLPINFPGNALLRIYKPFIRPHLDYADINYDKPNNLKTFKNVI